MIAAPRQLSPREREILLLLDEPRASYKSVARELGISPRTVSAHLNAAYQRLGVHRYHEAIRLVREDVA